MRTKNLRPTTKGLRPSSFLCNLRIKDLVVSTLVFVLLTLSPGCNSGNQNSELVVSAAVSLKEAFNEIAALHQQRSGVKVRFNFGASGALQKQIESGAPVDIFASAGARQMDELANKDLIIPSTRKDFARNELVLVVPYQGLDITSFDELTRSEIRKIAVGNPKTVPAGQYTEQALVKLKLLPALQPKLIYAEDVRQVLDYVVRDEVDAGVVYASDVSSTHLNFRQVARAADDSHDPILYPIAIIKGSRQQEAAQKFIDLVVSPEGQAILVKHDFMKAKQ
ncbi:MAG TPA: molybdate ABC transporter substrate-binding protein [Pyrinomonadaceae bacterium]|nr:molybdate ABC transporter substrate-binding protein [Pyrinomonadaceae bacterium]